jgi:alkanesulfonate monooxygenase SsuD/methylene tetrahydromethanopterin reductase-like flavin-dependent oxidoreductase (luciferase family)
MSISRLGVVLPPTGSWQDQASEYRWAEEVGYDVAYTYDHLTHFTMPGDFLAEGFASLSAAAAITQRIEVGTLVASATLHSPVALARLAATIDDISGGRLVLGLGAGSPRCARADRDEQPTPGEMFERFRDVVLGYRAVMGGASEWSGHTRSFSGLETSPLPEVEGQPPFLMLAAHGPKALRLTVEHGDGWNTYGGPGSTTLEPEEFWAEIGIQGQRFEAACAAAGRDPASLRRSLLLGFGTVIPAASLASYVESAERAGDLGFDELVVYGPHSSGGERFRTDPAVHEQAIARLRG